MLENAQRSGLQDGSDYPRRRSAGGRDDVFKHGAAQWSDGCRSTLGIGSGWSSARPAVTRGLSNSCSAGGGPTGDGVEARTRFTIYRVAKALLSKAPRFRLPPRWRDGSGAFVASLPLVSTLGVIWLWRDTHEPVGPGQRRLKADQQNSSMREGRAAPARISSRTSRSTGLTLTRCQTLCRRQQMGRGAAQERFARI